LHRAPRPPGEAPFSLEGRLGGSPFDIGLLRGEERAPSCGQDHRARHRQPGLRAQGRAAREPALRFGSGKDSGQSDSRSRSSRMPISRAWIRSSIGTPLRYGAQVGTQSACSTTPRRTSFEVGSGPLSPFAQHIHCCRPRLGDHPSKLVKTNPTMVLPFGDDAYPFSLSTRRIVDRDAPRCGERPPIPAMLEPTSWRRQHRRARPPQDGAAHKAPPPHRAIEACTLGWRSALP
jgi:hypothetical protein